MKLVEALRMANIAELGADVLELPYKVRNANRVTGFGEFFFFFFFYGPPRVPRCRRSFGKVRP
jgi:hypothetical protein